MCKYLKIFFIFNLIILLSSCSDNNSSDTGLTGVWRSENNNILYLIVQNESTVSINSCNAEPPFIVFESNGTLGGGGTDLFIINNDTQIEFAAGAGIFAGIKLDKLNSNNRFSSGSATISSANIANLSTTTDVCAYRETDDVHNIISAPYEGGFISITIGINSKATGSFSFTSEALLLLDSPALPGLLTSANSGNITVHEYTNNRFRADFQFTASDGNSYSGSVDVDI